MQPIPAACACAQLHQGVGIHRQLILKCFQHRLRAVALSGSFPCGSLCCRSLMFISQSSSFFDPFRFIAFSIPRFPLWKKDSASIKPYFRDQFLHHHIQHSSGKKVKNLCSPCALLRLQRPFAVLQGTFARWLLQSGWKKVAGIAKAYLLCNLADAVVGEDKQFLCLGDAEVDQIVIRRRAHIPPETGEENSFLLMCASASRSARQSSFW